jgi:hypothetical protein
VRILRHQPAFWQWLIVLCAVCGVLLLCAVSVADRGCSRGSMQRWRRISAVLLMEEPTMVRVKKPRISAVLVAALP